MKKGFTLIELLAVIVILAVLALIATPIVLNIIDDSKKNATLRSSENYIKAIEFSIAKSVMENKKLSDGTYNLMKNGNICLGTKTGNSCDNELIVEVAGETPESGTITIKSRKIDSYEFTYASGFVVVNGEISGEDANEEPNITLAQFIIDQAKDNNYYYETTPDFSKVTADGEYGLYQTQDDLGTSYYFRGDTDNNYVEFAGFYWRIIRINGDNTIRLIYDGTSKQKNGVVKVAGISKTSYDGYEGNEGEAIYTESTIKGVIDSWYIQNIKNLYGDYVADSIFCNDYEETGFKDIISDQYGNDISICEEPNWCETYYGTLGHVTTTDIEPKLTCNTEYINTVANQKLDNPIGLITAEEVMLAGGSNIYQANHSYYLYIGSLYWTLSPAYYTSEYGYYQVYFVDGDGSIASHSFASDNDERGEIGVEYSEMYARPVINLKVDVSFAGEGSYDNPYIIVTG